MDCHGYRINYCSVIVFYTGIKEHTIRPLRKISPLMDPVVSENLHHLLAISSSQTK